jgi:Tol biopolymer transport system component
MTIGLAITGAVIAALIVVFATGKFGKHGANFALRDRTQLTFSGNVLGSAISRDGKQLAFVTQNCSGSACTYSVDIEDVGGTSTHRILDKATALNTMEWSPDRRGLIFTGTINGRYGAYMISALGAPPVFLTPGTATFWAGGDSLLITPPSAGVDSIHPVRVASLSGAVHDSIMVAGLGTGITGLSVSPDGKWIVALIIQRGHGLWQVIDRNGKVADKVLNSCTCPGVLSTGALWLTRAGEGFESIVRVGLDENSGLLSKRQDTLYAGRFNNFTVTGDGQSMVIDEGTRESSVWALEVADMMKGKFAEPRRFVKSSNSVFPNISPDGARLLIARNLPSSSGGSERRLSIMPFAGGEETQVSMQGKPFSWGWADSVTVLITTQTPTGTHVALTDVRTGGISRTVDLPDSIYRDITPLADGWAWIPATGDRVVIQRGSATKEIKAPAWYGGIAILQASTDGKQIGFVGWNNATNDTLGLDVVSVDGGTPVHWGGVFSESLGLSALDGGGFAMIAWPTQQSIAVYRFTAAGKVASLGTVPRPADYLTVSGDLKRAALLQREYHGDSWMSRVVKP